MDPDLNIVKEPSPVTVGGVRGQELDVQPVNPPRCTYYGGPGNCWLIMPWTPEDPFAPSTMASGGNLITIGPLDSVVPPRETTRIVVVTVQGQQIVIFFDDDIDRFPTTVKRFEQVISSLVWS